MSATDKDLIKLGVRIIGQCVRLMDICRRRYYDTTNNNTHVCGSYSYTTTTRPNTTSYIQTLGREERSFLFSPRSGGNNGHRSSSSRHASSSTTTRKLLRKKPGVRTWIHFMCLSDRISDKIPNPTQNQFCKRKGLD